MTSDGLSQFGKPTLLWAWRVGAVSAGNLPKIMVSAFLAIDSLRS